MKIVYRYDSTSKKMESNDLVADDYELLENETFIAPSQGLYEPLTFDGEKWLGVSEQVWKQSNQQEETPTSQQTINANLMLQVATLTAKIAKLEGSASNG